MAEVTEIKADIKDAEENKSFSGSVVDGRYIIRYSIDRKVKDEMEYINFQKIFDSIDEFNSYNQVFFEGE